MPNRYCIRMDTRRVLEPVPRKLAVAFFSLPRLYRQHGSCLLVKKFGEVLYLAMTRQFGDFHNLGIQPRKQRRLLRNRTSGITLRLVESTRSSGFRIPEGSRRLQNQGITA